MPRIDMQATGNNIKVIMNRCGVTVVDIQTVFGFNTPQAIYKWIRGVAMPTIDNIVVLAMIFNVKVDDIIVMTK